MSGEPRSGGVGEDRPPTLANREAAQRVGEAARGRLAESIDSTGKALAVIAGFGAFFIAAGYFVEWQRFRQGRLPSEQVLPLIAKDQIAAAGARELAISLLFVGISLALLGFVLVWLARWTQGRSGRFARLLNQMLSKDIAFLTAIVGGLTLLVVPLDGSGVFVAVIVTGLFLYGLLLIRRFLETGDHDRFPLWRLIVAVGLAAIVLAGARQSEFGEVRPSALVCLSDGTSFEGDYVASDSDKVLIRKRSFSSDRHDQGDGQGGNALPRAEAEKREVEESESESKRQIGLECASESGKGTADKTQVRRRLGKRPRLIVIPGAKVEEILLVKAYAVLPYENSLLGEILSGFPGLDRRVEIACIPPECRAGDERIGPSTYL